MKRRCPIEQHKATPPSVSFGCLKRWLHGWYCCFFLFADSQVYRGFRHDGSQEERGKEPNRVLTRSASFSAIAGVLVWTNAWVYFFSLRVKLPLTFYHGPYLGGSRLLLGHSAQCCCELPSLGRTSINSHRLTPLWLQARRDHLVRQGVDYSRIEWYSLMTL